MADNYLDDIVQNIYTKCDLSDFNLLIHATDELAKKANRLSKAFNRALTGEQQVALAKANAETAKSNEVISWNTVLRKQQEAAIAKSNETISWNNKLKSENNNQTKLAYQETAKKLSQDRKEVQLSKEKVAQINKENKARFQQRNILSRITSLLGVYFGINTLRNIFNTGQAVQLLQQSIQGLTKSGQDWEFVNEQAFKFGVSLETVARGYKNFFSSARMAGVEKTQIQSMFADLLLSSRAIGASEQQTGGALLALEQMYSKGTVSMEELRRQLGNALPGAFETGALAMGMDTATFSDAVQKKLIKASDFVPRFIQTYKKQVANGWKDVEQTVNVAKGRLGVAWEQFTFELMNGETGKELAKGLNMLANAMKSDTFRQFVRILGQTFTLTLRLMRVAFNFLRVIRRYLGIILVLVGAGGITYAIAKIPMLLDLIIGRGKIILRIMQIMFSGKMLSGLNLLTKGMWKTIAPMMALYAKVLAVIAALILLEDIYTGIFHPEKDSYTGRALDRNRQNRPWWTKNPLEILNEKIQNDTGFKVPGVWDFLQMQRAIKNRENELGVITGGAGYLGELPNLSKEQEIATNVNVGDINIYSNGGNPQEIAQEVQNQLVALFMGQGLTLNVESMVT